ncbi:MAG TPA: C13 family peptidase [Candidatus Lokiarchaeia archaeon]|nr:C13 family peptidase [Candidatus Lokiarchaeia archaeon]
MAFVLPGLTIGTATATATPVQRAPITPSTLSETQSAAIIIAGDRSDHALQNNIMYGADQVYNILINNRGFLPSRVYFLGSRLDAGVNAISTYSNIQYAFQTWAPTVTDASHGLVIYMFDHGGSGAMAIPGGQLNAPDINTWLNALPTSRIIIVYEACESGSFIPYLSAPNRIVIASTDPADSAYASSNWAYFSESFWGSIATGTDIGNSFVSGIYNIARNGHYSDYIPLIDDNHDSVGHTAQNVLVVIFPVLFLPNGGDGNDALNTLIQGYGGSLFVPIVHFHIPIYYLDTGGNGINIHINSVTNNTPVHFFVRAIAPTWKPTPPANNTVMGQDTGPGMYLLNITRNVDGAYVGTIPSGGGPFSQGAYNISIYAMTSAGISGQVFTQDYVNANGSAPTERTPPAVAITMPQNGSISGNVNVTAIGDDRLGLNRIELYVDGALMKNVTMPAYRPYPAATFLLNSTSLSNGDHTILAKAYNTAGLSSTSTVVVKVQNGATSGFLPVIVIGAAIAGIAWIASRRKRSGVIAQ